MLVVAGLEVPLTTLSTAEFTALIAVLTCPSGVVAGVTVGCSAGCSAVCSGGCSTGGFSTLDTGSEPWGCCCCCCCSASLPYPSSMAFAITSSSEPVSIKSATLLYSSPACASDSRYCSKKLLASLYLGAVVAILPDLPIRDITSLAYSFIEGSLPFPCLRLSASSL